MPSSSHLGSSYSFSNKSIWEKIIRKSTRVIQVKWISLRYGSKFSTRDLSLEAFGSSPCVWFSVAPDGRSQTVPSRLLSPEELPPLPQLFLRDNPPFHRALLSWGVEWKTMCDYWKVWSTEKQQLRAVLIKDNNYIDNYNFSIIFLILCE